MQVPRKWLWFGIWLFVACSARGEETNPSGAPADWPEPILDSEPNSLVLFDQLEYRKNDGPDGIGWDVLGWYGGDYQRLWIETEGEDLRDGEGGAIERLDVLYGRLIARFWDFQAGLGYQLIYGPDPDIDRFFAVVGIQGLAPQWFEVDANLRVSEDGDLSADLEVDYDLLITQRLIIQPQLETAFEFQDVDEFDVATGFTSVGLALRLRYEISRKFAPYVGVAWERLLGDTADLANSRGEDREETAVIAGVRIWF